MNRDFQCGEKRNIRRGYPGRISMPAGLWAIPRLETEDRLKFSKFSGNDPTKMIAHVCVDFAMLKRLVNQILIKTDASWFKNSDRR